MKSTTCILSIAMIFELGCAAVAPSPSKREAVQAPPTPAPSARWVHEDLARSNPLEFLKTCRQHYLDQVRDYRCVFHMRERAGAGLDQPQKIAIKFRENPYSVHMEWLENSAGAKRISFVKDRWVKDGRQLALVVPSGIANVLLPEGIKLDIHGKEFKKSSPRSVDQFGFRKTLERAIWLCEQAQGDPAFSLVYAGRQEYEGRPQYVVERRLPFSSGDDKFPDRLAVFYIDEEWLAPIGVWSYGDEEKQALFGEFITTDIELNVGLTDSDFE